MSPANETAASIPPVSEPYVIADHPVLDLLNTGGVNHEGMPYDHLRSDEDVIIWLARTGWPVAPPAAGDKPGALLAAARELREIVRDLVVRRKAGKRGDPRALNGYLRRAVSHPQLVWDAPSDLRLQRLSAQRGAGQVLLPLAEAAAELLVAGDFSLVRTCEHPECVLWFYDRTKSHRRRWCSMAVCGNRHKVTEFRKRKQQ